MNREYPHRSKGGPRSDSRSWMCRCGAEPTFLSQVHAGEWGTCALALEEALAETEARAERAEAERDAARGLLESLPTWGAYGWRDAADSVRAKLAENAKQIVDLMRERDEMRREIRADTDKAVAAALEAKAKELDDYARDYFPGVEHPSVLSFRNGVHKAASIVRGGR